MTYYIKLYVQAWNTMLHSDVDPAVRYLFFMVYSRPSIQKERARETDTQQTRGGETAREDKRETKERSICFITKHHCRWREKYKRSSLLLSHHGLGERDGWGGGRERGKTPTMHGASLECMRHVTL